MASRKLIVEIIGDSSSLERALGRARVSSRSFSSGVAGGILKATAAIGGITLGVRALDEALVGSVRSFASFQTSMQRVVGLAGGSQASIAGLSQQILDLAPKVGKGPQELGDALYFVASAGIAADKQLGVVTVSAKAAAAGLGSTIVVADAVTSVLNAYGQANITAAKATDILTATVREGKGEADAFAPSLGLIIPIAAKLGVSFDQVGAALASMTQQGTSASRASIQLSQFLSTLLKVTPQSAKGFASVGLNADKLRQQLGQRGGLLLVIREINSAFGDNTKALAQAIPNVRALRGVLQLVGKDSQQVEGVFQRLGDSTGSLSTAFGAIANTTQQQFNQLTASLNVAQITIGAALAPSIEKVLKPLSEWLAKTKNQRLLQKDLTKAVNEATHAVKESIGVIKDIVAALTPFAKTAKETSDQLGGLKNTLELLVGIAVAAKLAKLSSSLVGVGGSAKGSAAEVAGLRRALALLPETIIITILIEGILHKKQIQDTVDKFLKGHGLGFLTGKHIDIPITANLKTLEQTRAKVAAIKGENDLLVKALDAQIDRLKKINVLEQQRAFVGGVKKVLEGFGVPAPATTSKTEPLPPTTQTTPKRRDAKKAAAAALKKQQDAFSKLIDALSFNLEKAGATKSLADDIAAQKKINAAIEREIAIEGRTTDLTKQLFEGRQNLIDLGKQQQQNQLAARAAQQFRNLGLTSAGEKITPSVSALSKRVQSVTKAVKGTVLDTPKTRTELAGIAKVLSGAFGKVGKDVRAAILQMLNDISSALSNTNDKIGPLTKTTSLNTKKLVAGLGLTPEQERQLRSRASRFNSAGRALATTTTTGRDQGRDLTRDRSQPFIIESTVNVNLDGQKLTTVVTKNQQRAKRRNPRQKRGPNRGIGV